MADFTALKTSIQTYIKQNGNEEITGEKLQEILLSMVTTLGDSAINDLITALNDEVAARQNADGTLQQNITNEATERGNADTALGGRIDDEATARANGDTALSNRLGSTITEENTAADQIGAEAEARTAADTALLELIDGITDNIENGYVYAGIATPSSTPASGKVFYLALTAGTYTNYDSTVVSQGINILKYNGSAWSLDAFIGIDDEPTPSSTGIPKSGGTFDFVIKNGSAFDISAHFASGGTLATYADLSAALTALNTLPAAYKRGGMSIRFVLTSDNSYIQARLMADSFTTDITHWQIIENSPRKGSKNLVDSDGIAKVSGEIFEISDLIEATIDKENKICEAYAKDGKHIYADLHIKDKVRLTELNTGDEYLEVEVDKNNRIHHAVRTDGKHIFPAGIEAGKMPTHEKYNIIFASFDSSEYDKMNADYVCTETNAQEVIQNAIDDWYAQNEFNAGCFFFCAGTYIMTHFIEPDPEGDDKNGTPYCIVMPRGKNGGYGSSMAHYRTFCQFEGAYDNILKAGTLFKLATNAYLLKTDGTTEALDNFIEDSEVYWPETTIESVTYPARYLVDNKRYSVIRCVSDPINAGGSMWCSYTMKIKSIKFLIDGSASNRTLTQYPIVMIDGIYASEIDIEFSEITVNSGIYEVSNNGADEFNVGFTGLRCNQGQSRSMQQLLKTVLIYGFYHGIEFGSEHWQVDGLAVLCCHIGIACGCYHDSYGSGHPNVFNNLAIERNYYPMYWYHNKPIDNLVWVSSGSWVMNGLGTEWYKYTYGGEETTGCHIENYEKAPLGIINCNVPKNVHLFDEESRSGLLDVVITKGNIEKCQKWSNIYGNPSAEHGIKAQVGEQSQIVYLTDKQCFAIWNNYNNNNPYGIYGWWERLDGTPIENI